MKKILTGLLAALVLIAIILALIAPIGPVPGFFIGGTPASAPEAWQDTSNTDEILFKVDGTLPRVITLWVVEYNSELHVVGNNESGWVGALGDGGPVEMRIEDNTYKLNAVKVTSDLEAIWTAYVDKYKADYPDIIDSFPPIEEAKLGASVFRLAR
ncbi:MAG: hypothetical protein AAF512_01235 [Pseudomonadota bacterium]